MAEKKEKPVDWEKLGEKAKKVNSDLGQALKELGNQNVTDFFIMLLIFSGKSSSRRRASMILPKQTQN